MNASLTDAEIAAICAPLATGRATRLGQCGGFAHYGVTRWSETGKSTCALTTKRTSLG